MVGGFANGAARSGLGRPAARAASGPAWVAGYSARMQEPGAEAIPEVRRSLLNKTSNALQRMIGSTKSSQVSPGVSWHHPGAG